jgi:addiction module HigA family antidote
MVRTPIHPGEILADELQENGLTATELARILDVPANRISHIVSGKRAITADTALRLGRYFGTSPDLWMNLQKTYELDLARKEVGNAIERESQETIAAAFDAFREMAARERYRLKIPSRKNRQGPFPHDLARPSRRLERPE